jgi:2-polyprenyl-3-methyl-5-hydroxy-6-metoxy-1,4-benzoquinol methylase
MSGRPTCLCNTTAPEITQLRWPTFGERKLYRCSVCETVQLYPLPKFEGSLEEIYNNATYLGKIDEQEYYGYWRAFEEHLRKRLGVTKSQSLVDFGAGRCYYHKFFAADGYRDVSSVEINVHSVRYAKEELGLGSVYVSVRELPRKEYDVIISNQVFEHLENPLQTMKELLLPILKPGGLLCFSVPNWRSLNRPVLQHRWLGYSAEDHVWFFQKDSIRRVLAAVPGIEIVDISIWSAVGKQYDGFRPDSVFKRVYYNTFWRVFELLGRGDQMIVAIRKTN